MTNNHLVYLNENRIWKKKFFWKIKKKIFPGKFEKKFFLKIVKNFLVDFRKGGGQLLWGGNYCVNSGTCGFTSDRSRSCGRSRNSRRIAAATRGTVVPYTIAPKDGHFFHSKNPGGVLIWGEFWGEFFPKDLLQKIFEIFFEFFFQIFVLEIFTANFC